MFSIVVEAVPSDLSLMMSMNIQKVIDSVWRKRDPKMWILPVLKTVQEDIEVLRKIFPTLTFTQAGAAQNFIAFKTT